MSDSVAFAQQVPICDQPLNDIFPIEQSQSNMRLQQQLMEPYNNLLEKHTGSQVQCICIKDSGWDSGFCTVFQNKIPKCIYSFTPSSRNSTKQTKHLLLYYSTEANSRSFHLIFNKRFDHLETLLTINRPKKELLAGSLRQSFVPNPLSKCPKRTFILQQKYHTSVSHMLSQPLKYFIERKLT